MQKPLRFLTCGSVDDGKSTLIGRLLYDSKAILADQFATLEKVSAKRGREKVDLALLTDGLMAEREQGITIDVAYRYFATPRRSFIIADCPGHEQYTRNMITGASTADAAIILVDATRGVRPQTRRHAYLVNLLGIKHVFVAINKLDAVGYSQARYEELVKEVKDYLAPFQIADLRFIPLSALEGDNLVDASENMPWWSGTPLLTQLEDLTDDPVVAVSAFRFPVQYVLRHHATDFRGYQGRVESGVVKVGDEIAILPSGFTSKITKIVTLDGELESAAEGQSVTLVLEDERDISRGDLFAHPTDAPTPTKEIKATVSWFADEPLNMSRAFTLRHGTSAVKCKIKNIHAFIDINTQESIQKEDAERNDIFIAEIALQNQIAPDSYSENRANGAFILVDSFTNNTVAVGLIAKFIDSRQFLQNVPSQFNI
jgi:sulfate adenylyltransferase subunit 1